jgi:hypothetical protein
MHVAIIMDGNGRWATERGLPRSVGHVEGAKTVRKVVEVAAKSQVDTLTIYAFSAANWARPSSEVSALMRLFGQYLFTETRRCVEQSIRINVIGRRDRLNESLLRSIEQSERLSASSHRGRLFVPVQHRRGRPARIARFRFQRRGLQTAAARGRLLRVPCGRRGSADSHGLGAAPQRFFAVGMRLRGALLRRLPVAGLRRAQIPPSPRRLRRTRTPLRRLGRRSALSPSTR